MKLQHCRPLIATAILLVPSLMLSGATPGAAVDTPTAPVLEPVPANATSVEATISGLSSDLRAAMDQEVATLFASRRQAVLALRAKLLPNLDAASALGLQAEIARLKETLEADCLEIQARYVRQAGLVEEAEAIEAELRRMRSDPRTPESDETTQPSPGVKE